MLNTIPVDHDSSVYTKLIKKGSGKQVMLGLTTQLVANTIGYKTGFVGSKTKFVGSGIGSIKATQEVGKQKNKKRENKKKQKKIPEPQGERERERKIKRTKCSFLFVFSVCFCL